MEVLFEIEARKQEQLSAIKAAINLWTTFTSQPKKQTALLLRDRQTKQEEIKFNAASCDMDAKK